MKRRYFITKTGKYIAGSLLLTPMFRSPVFGTTNLAASLTNTSHKENTGQLKTQVNYKCLFNHELAILTGAMRDIPTGSVQYLIKKLAGTDVDAVMCCPMVHRTNFFPSEVDPAWKSFSGIRNLPKFPSFDYVFKYLNDGGDPVRETMEECRKLNIDFFINYRLNDPHDVQDIDFPLHNPFWREHPEYWLANTNNDAFSFSDNTRLHNYMIPEVREYYYSIIEELCFKYDVDGVELDFQRCRRLIRDSQISEGISVLTSFVQRIRNLLDRVGQSRFKYLKLSVRVPETVSACEKFGLDITTWDSLNLLDMINISPFFSHTTEIGIEDFKAKTKNAKIYGEMNYVTSWDETTGKRFYRYTSWEDYRASAFNFISRGAGVSIFNFDYVDSSLRGANTPVLKKISDVEFLKTISKKYTVYMNSTFPIATRTFPFQNDKTFNLYIADDTSKVSFQNAVLRIETREDSTNRQISAWFNGTQLIPFVHQGTELFPLNIFASTVAYPAMAKLKFFEIPLKIIKSGNNTLRIKNMDSAITLINFQAIELALYCCSTTSLIEETNDQNIKIFPNPTKGQFKIEAENIKGIKVFDMQGRIILNKTHGELNRVNISQQPKGQYFIKILTNQSECQRTIILE